MGTLLRRSCGVCHENHWLEKICSSQMTKLMPSNCKSNQSRSAAEGLPSPGIHSRSQPFLEQVYMVYSDGGSGPRGVSTEVFNIMQVI